MGLSVARNAGLNSATGDYVMFVDGDDFLDHKAVQLVIDAVSDDDVDVLCFGYVKVFDGESVRTKVEMPDQCLSKSGLCKISVAAWAKAYNLSFLKKFDIKFKPGAYYEDNLFHWKSLVCARKVAVLRRAIYNYRYSRPGSLMDLSRRKTKGMAIHHLYSLNDVFEFLYMSGKIEEYKSEAQFLFEKMFRYGYEYLCSEDVNSYIECARNLSKKWGIFPRKFTLAYDAMNGNVVIRFKYRLINSVVKRFAAVKEGLSKKSDFFPLN